MLYLNPAQYATWPVGSTPYEADALAFCRAWHGGQAEFVLHTSGSTGTPKPITLTREQMRASAQLTGRTLGLQPGDEALVCLNVNYVAGVMMLVRGLELGLPMTIIEPSSHPLSGFSSNVRFAFTALVPLQLQTLLEDITSDREPAFLPILNGMKAILVGGAATSPGLEQALQLISAPIYATYGMTETVSHIALRQLNGPARSEWFTALNGVQLGTDDRGCLHITAAASNHTLVQTNDVVELCNARQFRVLGRADLIINSGGVKIQPEPIEQIILTKLAEFGLSARLFVAGLPDDRLGQALAVISEPLPMRDAQWAAVQDAVRAQLGPYSVPRAWLTVPAFAETATGKVDRNQTIAMAVSQIPAPEPNHNHHTT